MNRIKLYDCNGIFTKQYITKGMCGAEKFINGTLHKVTFDSMVKVANAQRTICERSVACAKEVSESCGNEES
jgi:hypothetical protein